MLERTGTEKYEGNEAEQSVEGGLNKKQGDRQAEQDRGAGKDEEAQEIDERLASREVPQFITNAAGAVHPWVRQ
jgi:hypothetical protein